MIYFCYSFFLCLLDQPELCGTISPVLHFLFSSVSMANLNSLVATIFFIFAFFYLSIYMVKHGQTEPFGSCIFLKSCSSFFFCAANQRLLLLTTFSSLNFLSNNTSLQSFERGHALFLMVFCFRRPFLFLL